MMRRNINQRNCAQAPCQCPRCQARRQAQCSCGRDEQICYQTTPLRMVDTERNTYTRPVNDLPYAMSYVRPQNYQNVYEPQQGFVRGTIFADLDQPLCCE